MPKLYIHFLNDTQVAALRAAGHDVEGAAVSAGQHVVAIIKASPIGAKIVDAMQTVEHGTNPDGSPMTGLEKFEHVVMADAAPLVLSFAADGGVKLLASVEDTAREVVQSLFNDLFSEAAKASRQIATRRLSPRSPSLVGAAR